MVLHVPLSSSTSKRSIGYASTASPKKILSFKSLRSFR